MVALKVSLIWPEAQSWHELPAEVWNLPSAQSLHDAVFTSANWPSSHAVQLSAL